MADSYPFLKGHGTENDFVLLPDHDGSVHGDLPAERVRAPLRPARRDRRRRRAAGDPHRSTCDPSPSRRAEWFMDYRNADGGASEMCGNGIRVFALHLARRGPGRRRPRRCRSRPATASRP